MIPNAQPPMTSLGQCTPRNGRVEPISKLTRTPRQTQIVRVLGGANSKATAKNVIIELAACPLGKLSDATCTG